MQSGMLVNIIHAKGVQNVATRQQMCHMTQNALSNHANPPQERLEPIWRTPNWRYVSRCRSAVVECFCQAKPDWFSIAPKSHLFHEFNEGIFYTGTTRWPKRGI
jgi:hypothetical protein